MTRRGRCSCGQLTVTATGDPVAVAICHCGECRRRTGSAFGYSGYWPETQVRIGGDSSAWSRVSATGRRLAFHFCGVCGATLWWRAEFLPGRIGIALGNLDGPDLAPTVAVWDSRRAPWLADLAAIECYAEGRL